MEANNKNMNACLQRLVLLSGLFFMLAGLGLVAEQVLQETETAAAVYPRFERIAKTQIDPLTQINPYIAIRPELLVQAKKNSPSSQSIAQAD